MTTVSGRVAAALSAHVDEVFALMGNGNAFLIDALASLPVRMTAVRHETATVASADAYYRVTRQLAVATTTYGPGFTNALTALGEAAQSRTPLLMVVGEAPTVGPRPWDIDQVSIAAAVGIRTFTVGTHNAAAVTLEAIHWALAQRIPAVLAIPYDLAAMPTTEAAISLEIPALPEPPSASREELRAVGATLSKAQRPLILAGRGARDAAEALGLLADRIGALTVSSAPAHGIFNGRTYDLGVCGGFASESSARLIREADVVLAVGVGLNQFTTSFGHAFNDDATLIQIDLLGAPTNVRVTTFIQSDAALAAEELLELTMERGTRRWDGQAEEARSSGTHLERDPGQELNGDGRLDPRSVMKRLNSILPSNRQLVSDGGHFIGWANTYLDIPRPDGITLVGTVFQSIGLGLPSASGVAVARPDDTIVAVVGDGGGLMGIPDLDSLIRTAASAVVLVFNDAGYGAEVHQYGSQGLSEAIMHIEQIDFATIARGMGAKAVVVETLGDLERIREWVQSGANGTFVADLRVTQNIRAPYIQEIIDLTLKKTR